MKDISVIITLTGDSLIFPGTGINRNISQWVDLPSVAQFIGPDGQEVNPIDLEKDFPGGAIRASVCPVDEENMFMYLQLHPSSLSNLEAQVIKRGLNLTSLAIPSTFIREGDLAAREIPLLPLEKVSLWSLVFLALEARGSLRIIFPSFSSALNIQIFYANRVSLPFSTP